MKVVLDTNLLISAALKAGKARETYDKAIGIATIVRSEHTLSELIRTLEKPKLQKYLRPEDKQQFVANFIALSREVKVTTTINASRDADDNMFLELAIDSQASCIVSGDPHLTELHPFQSIPILNPADFLAWVEKREAI